MEPGALLLLRWLPWVAEAIDYPDTSLWRALGKDDCISRGCQAECNTSQHNMSEASGSRSMA